MMRSQPRPLKDHYQSGPGAMPRHRDLLDCLRDQRLRMIATLPLTSETIWHMLRSNGV